MAVPLLKLPKDPKVRARRLYRTTPKAEIRNPDWPITGIQTTPPSNGREPQLNGEAGAYCAIRSHDIPLCP